MPTTIERILDAAERLFARQGVGATSLRAITADAGVNTAAIHYHFGSKEALVEAVLVRRIAPLNQERLKQIERLEAAAGEGPVPPRALLAAFLTPVLAMQTELRERAVPFGSMFAWLRIESERGSGLRPHRHFEEVKARFAAAACRGRDDLGPDEAMERLDYAIGAMGHELVNQPSDASEAGQAEFFQRVERLLDFLAPGLAARGACRVAAAEALGERP